MRERVHRYIDVMRVEANTHVLVKYVLRANGEIVDAGETPIEYVHGYRMLVPGLEAALAGMRAGERRTIALDPDEAFGARDEELVFRVDREELPQNANAGDEFVIEPDAIDVRVVSIDEKEATLDANHPLAGVSVVYDVEILAVRAATDDEIRAAADEEHAREELVQIGRKPLKAPERNVER